MSEPQIDLKPAAIEVPSPNAQRRNSRSRPIVRRRVQTSGRSGKQNRRTSMAGPWTTGRTYVCIPADEGATNLTPDVHRRSIGR